MFRIIAIFFTSCVLVLGLTVCIAAQGKNLNTAPPAAARALVKRAAVFAAQDKYNESIAALKKAIFVAPNYLQAHADYVRIKTYYLNVYNDVRTEYEDLMSKDPNNPIYPMALALGTGGAPPSEVIRSWHEKVMQLAPEWAWGHYAKARLIMAKEPNEAVTELTKAIEKEPSMGLAYSLLISLQDQHLGKIDEGLKTAEKMAAQPELRAAGLSQVWRLRLGRDQGVEEAKAKLRSELSRLFVSSHDIDTLSAVRNTYSSLLNDEDAANKVEKKILKIDPSWHHTRGLVTFFGPANISGVSRYEPIAGRQMKLFQLVFKDAKVDYKERIAQLEQLLTLRPGAIIKRFIYEELFRVAEKSRDASVVVKYGNVLRAIDPNDIVVSAKMALILAEQKSQLAEALGYARIADSTTTEFRPLQRPANADPDRFRNNFPEEVQRKIYKRQRALALDAHGWVLSQMGNFKEAEAKLRQSVELGRSEKNLSHLAETLRLLGLKDEAEKFAIEANNEYLESLKRQFVNEQAKDFQLKSIDGRDVKLSELKGKVVLVNFWATWCGPCKWELPHLAEIYEKYRNSGLEILAIATDDKTSRHLIPSFVKTNNLNFPVLYDEGVEKLYGINGLPASIFIDKKGQIRFQSTGFDGPKEMARKFETIINDLLK